MSRTSRPDLLAARTRAQQALRLRMSGATLQQVADRLGYNNRQAVWKATTSLLQRQESDLAAEWREMHIARLERLLLSVWYAAIDGEVQASQQAVRILVELGRVTGVAAPTRVEAPHPDVAIRTVVKQWIPEDEWMRRYVIAWEQVRSTGALRDDRCEGEDVEDDGG